MKVNLVPLFSRITKLLPNPWLGMVLFFLVILGTVVSFAEESSPYQYLVNHEAQSVAFKNWVWTVEESAPGYATIINPKERVQSIFPEFSEWKVISSLKDAQLQRWIDQTFAIYFQSPQITNILCYLYSHSLSLHWHGGVSLPQAVGLMNSCALPKDLLEYTTRVQSFQKEYVFIFTSDREKYRATAAIRPLSWTDMENVTYLFVTPETRFSDLVLSILHEISVQTDSKAQLLPTTHFLNTGVNLSDEEIRLLRLASVNSISLTFSALRAFNVEKIFLNELNLDAKTVNDELNCQEKFFALFTYVKGIANRYTSSNQGQSMASELYWMVAQNMSQEAQEQGFKTDLEAAQHLLTARIRVESGILFDTEVNFCEYMSSPYLSRFKHRTMSGHGPRPPIVGGSFRDTGGSQDALFERRVLDVFKGR